MCPPCSEAWGTHFSLHHVQPVATFGFNFAAVEDSGILQLCGLTAGYAASRKTCTVVDGFTVNVHPGTFTCVLGVNGVGKSTLLRTLARLQMPLAGSVSYGGRNLAAFPRRALARTVGVVLTVRNATALQLTVRELVELGRSPYTGFFGRLTREDSDVVLHAMEVAGVASMAARRVGMLSDGERQKVFVARALAQQTPVMLLDEPTAFLDYPAEAAMFALMRRMAHGGGKTVIAATHSVAAALREADMLWLLRRSATPLVATPREVLASNLLAECFGSSLDLTSCSVAGRASIPNIEY